jgi:hypothetical protein
MLNRMAVTDLTAPADVRELRERYAVDTWLI